MQVIWPTSFARTLKMQQRSPFRDPERDGYKLTSTFDGVFRHQSGNTAPSSQREQCSRRYRPTGNAENSTENATGNDIQHRRAESGPRRPPGQHRKDSQENTGRCHFSAFQKGQILLDPRSLRTCLFRLPGTRTWSPRHRHLRQQTRWIQSFLSILKCRASCVR